MVLGTIVTRYVPLSCELMDFCAAPAPAAMNAASSTVLIAYLMV
jgi:hypothetical protein